MQPVRGNIKTETVEAIKKTEKTMVVSEAKAIHETKVTILIKTENILEAARKIEAEYIISINCSENKNNGNNGNNKEKKTTKTKIQ